MDIQPTLSPFNPALSYSLLVDDIFNLEDQNTTTILTDEEAADYEDYNNNNNNNNNNIDNNNNINNNNNDNNINNNLEESDHISNFKDREADIKHSTDLQTDIMEERRLEELLIFDPHISDGKDVIELEAMDISQDVKGDITNYIYIKCQDNTDDNRSCLLSTLCSTIESPASINSPNDVKGPHQMTLSPLVGTSPGPLSPMLPPCRVCGEKASGFHYGANTCEACKGFFRRSLQRKTNYRCLGSNDCDISSGKRNVCAACRYRKCLSLGMSKNAIKTGRYTHAKKTKDIQEVKRLQRKQQLLREEQTDSSQLPPCRLQSDVIDDETAEEILDKIMNVHRQQTPHTPEFFEKLSQKEQDYLIKRKLKEEMFGPLKPISQDEYSNIYHCTGIDVDGRKAMLEHMLPCIERAVKRFVTFAKAVPGFKELPLEDQIKLIKGSRFEAWLISSYRAFNSEHLLYTHYCGSTVHLENMSRLYDESFLRDVFKMVGDIKKLDLTEEEECVLKAILIFFRDRSLLQDPDLVDIHQARLVQTLSIVHRKRKPKDRIFFGKVSAILTEMRTLTDIHTTQENKIQVEWATDVPIPPLLYELFYV